MKPNRILIGFGLLVVLAVVAFAVTRDEEVPEFKSPIEAVDSSEVDTFEVIRPGEDNDRSVLAKRDKTWRIVDPMDAPADQRAVENALTKIAEIRILDEASRSKDAHEELGVDEAHAIRLKVKKGGRLVFDVLLGELKSGFTMVRVPGNDVVYRVSGSIRQVFNKAPKDWRDKVIFDVQAEDFARLEFQSPNGRFAFNRGEGEWIIDGPPIENYDTQKVSSMVTSLAKLRSMDFEDRKSPAEVGLGPDAPTVKFTLAEGGGSFTLRIGNSFPYNNTERYYVQREGNAQIFVISKYLADRFRPEADRFQNTRRRGPGGKDAGISKRGDAAPGKLPPEVERQVQEQLAKQRMMKSLPGQPPPPPPPR